MKINEFIYPFEKGDGKNKMLLGGKGANLCEMTQIGLNVPPGFVVTTEACLEYINMGKLPDGLMESIIAHVKELETKTGKAFGGETNPLLVSVRSGSALSMPGMMDTILNLGLNPVTMRGLIAQTGTERFAYDSYRRFIQLFGKVALGVADEAFDHELEDVKNKKGINEDLALSYRDLREISDRFLEVVESATGNPFPEDPYKQLEIAVKAVFNSWNGKRAVDYRREFNISPDMANGTAVNVVAMVFGNLGESSATGVGFTRYPDTGENRMFGEYLINAQGEDVVAGIRTPKPIDELKNEMPEQYRQLIELRNRLEKHYREVQDFEFTIEKGKLYCLQTRNGKMNTYALTRTSVDMQREGLISKEEALLRIKPEALNQLLFPQINPGINDVPIARGLPASPGAACGIAVFDADRAKQIGGLDKKVILVREETKPDDIHGFFAAEGILTSRGGKTSHAAVVARGMGKPCVAGAEGINVNVNTRKAIVGSYVISEGDKITIDGTTGDVYLGEVPMVEPEFSSELEVLLGWADEEAKLSILANADTPDDARKARRFGARGIGLCRTERMFNSTDRLPTVVEMILSDSEEKRRTALAKLLPMQRADFKEMFKAMAPYPVTVRLLDPPIHEFLPTENRLVSEIECLENLLETIAGMNILHDMQAFISQDDGSPIMVEKVADLHNVEKAIKKKQSMLKKVRSLSEINPMLGHRGVRLGISFPEIYSMQIRAILEAAAECLKEGVDIVPEMMVPQVCTVQELNRVKSYVDVIHREVETGFGVKIEFKFGSMMEVVRACMRAGSLAEQAEFFSFGTNDLTQAAFSFSREDVENKFLPMYNENEILQDNPFEMLDVKGVGKLMELAIKWGRKTRPGMKVGICGEHGGHPASIMFCHSIGLSYASCSGPRIPVARLAAAHAALSENVRPA